MLKENSHPFQNIHTIMKLSQTSLILLLGNLCAGSIRRRCSKPSFLHLKQLASICPVFPVQKSDIRQPTNPSLERHLTSSNIAKWLLSRKDHHNTLPITKITIKIQPRTTKTMPNLRGFMIPRACAKRRQHKLRCTQTLNRLLRRASIKNLQKSCKNSRSH